MVTIEPTRTLLHIADNSCSLSIKCENHNKPRYSRGTLCFDSLMKNTIFRFESESKQIIFKEWHKWLQILQLLHIMEKNTYYD